MKKNPEAIEADEKQRAAAERFARKPKGCRHHWPFTHTATDIGVGHCVNCGEPYEGKAQ